MKETGQPIIIDERYVLRQILGRGGVGAVWSAVQLPSRRRVALKLLRAAYSDLPHLRRRFAREARAASRLSHDHITAVYDFGTDRQGQMFIAMELVEGPPLRELIAEGVSLLGALELVDRLLAALSHAHARGVVHRDLKPENVLMAPAGPAAIVGAPKLVDFGIATIAIEPSDARETRQGEVVGTPQYMSPEQAAGERNLGPRTDLYNVGLILYELLAGAHPFGDVSGVEAMRHHVREPVPPVRPRPGLEVPRELGAAVMRALSKDPIDRCLSAARMRAELQPWLQLARQTPSMQRQPEAVDRGADVGARGEAGASPHEMETRLRVTVEEPGASDETIYTPSRADTEPEAAPVPPVAPDFRYVPLVGRAEERERLLGLARDVEREERGCIVGLEGEAGIGKTRLAMWFKEYVEERGLMRGHIGVFTPGSGALHGVQEVIESVFRTRSLGREAAAARIAERLRSWGREDASDADALIDFLRPRHGGLPGAEARAEAGSTSSASGGRTGSLFALLTRALEAATFSRPRLVILDDAHRAGRELVDFLEYLLTEVRYRRLPLVVIVSLRPDALAERPALRQRYEELARRLEADASRLVLGGLGADASRDYVRAVLGGDDELAALVHERSAGNPLHLSMVLRYLRDQDLIEWREGAMRAREPGRVAEVVPPGIGELFSMRIRAVEAREGTDGRLEELLRRMACAGGRFSYEVLAEMIRLEGDVRRVAHFDDDFEMLLAEGLITEVVGRGEEWYVFHNSLMRDYLLRESAGPGTRRRLHRLAADALAALHPNPSASISAEIAAHRESAGQLAEAISAHRRAARRARRAWALRQSAASYRSCVRLCDRVLGLRADAPETFPQMGRDGAFERAGLAARPYLEALTQLGDLYEGFGSFERAERAYRRVVRIVGKPDAQTPDEAFAPLCEAWLGLGHVAWQRGDFEAARWAFARVRELVAVATEVHEATGWLDNAATRGLARVAWHRGDYDEARALATDALEQARDSGRREAEAESLWILGEIERMIGERTGARRRYDASFALFTEEGMPHGVARNLLSMAQLARYHKDFAEARALYEQALERYERLGDRRGAAMCTNGLGEIARFEGDFERALELYERALSIFRPIGARYDVATIYVNLGLVEMRRSRFERAEELLSAAFEIASTDGDYPYLLAGIEYNLALVKALRGEIEESERLLGSVFDLNERVPIAELDFAQPLEQLGRLRAAGDSEHEALAIWERARQIYVELGLGDDAERVTRAIESLRS